MPPTRDPPQNKRPKQTKSEGLKTNIPSKWTGKKSWGSNTHFRQNRLQKKGHEKRPRRSLHNTQGRIHLEDINIINIYAPDIGAPKYIRKILEDFKKDIDRNTIIVRNFNTPLSKMDKSSKHNINKDIVALNNALDEMDLTDIYRVFHPKEAKYTFFSNAHGTFSKIGHMIGHKRSLNKIPYDLTFNWNIINKRKKSKQNITRNTEVKNNLTIARGEWGGDSGERGFQELL